ncbi:uncharacterized protein LOC124418587 [Lucilia cuprina]|uniref:uncharacterized protein LOC124418587 n=1 Tax=Lucilia cuprina TaxID=7375 RepID=UPI001F062B89|nr:uncharacterized protein LOC124418587 [Lucilia cuprina]
MDANQFAIFMKTQQDLITQISKLTVGASSSSAVPSSNIINTALVPNFEAFKETFRNYIQWFTNYVNMKNVENNKEYCTKLLLNSIGAKHFDRVTALAAPKIAAEIQYDDLLKLLENYLAPKRNVLVAQHKFLSKYQSEGQSVADFVAVLRTDIIDCEFVSDCACKSSISDVFLRAQFIRGINDNGIREQLLQSNATKFEEIVLKALAFEAAKCDAKELSQAAANSSNASVNKIFNKIKVPIHPRIQHQHKRKVNYEKLGIAGLCLRCGRNDHFAKDCRSSSKLKCNLCAKHGHVAKVCIASLLADSLNAGPKNTQSTRGNSTNQVRSDNSNYGIYKIVDVYCNDYSNRNSDRYYANISIEGKTVKFEVDSGSGYSFLPRSMFKELRLSNVITPTNIVFRSYTQNTFTPDGKVHVHVKFNNISIIDDLYVVPDGCTALIGRTWIRRLGINLNELDNGNSAMFVTNSITDSNQIEDLMAEFASVFDQKIGCIPNYKISLQLRENSTPSYTKERQIPYALTERVNKELDELQKRWVHHQSGQ